MATTTDSRQRWKITVFQATQLAAAFSYSVLLATVIGPGECLDAFYFVAAYTVALGAVIGSAVTYIGSASSPAELEGADFLSIDVTPVIITTLLVTGGLVALVVLPRSVPQVCVAGKSVAGFYAYYFIFALTSLVNSWCAALLVKAGKPVVTIAASIFVPIAACGYLMLDRVSHNVYSLLEVILLAAVVQFIAQATQIASIPGLVFARPTRYYLRKLLLAVLSAFAFTAYPIIDGITALKLPEAAMSYQALSQRIIIALGSVVVAASFYSSPRLFRLYRQDNNLSLARDFITQSASTILFSVAAIFALFSLAGEALITITMGHGKLGSADVVVITNNVEILTIGMAPMLVTSNIFRLFYELQKAALPALIGALWLILYASLSQLGTTYLGFYTMSVAYSASWIAVGVFSWMAMRRVVGLPAGN